MTPEPMEHIPVVAPQLSAAQRILRRPAAFVGLIVLLLVGAACLGSLPWTLGAVPQPGGGSVPRSSAGALSEARLPPFWISPSPGQAKQLNSLVADEVIRQIAAAHGITPEDVRGATPQTHPAAFHDVRARWPRFMLGTDALGRSLLIRLLAGGGISIVVGLAAAAVSVFIGTLYGAAAGYAGGRIDGVMMRLVDVMYGLPYVLLVVLLAIAGEAVVDEYVTRHRARAAWVEQRITLPGGDQDRGVLAQEAARVLPQRELSERARTGVDLLVLLVAIGGTSWLTMARVIRGEVLSLQARPFIEAARAMGLRPHRVFLRHLLPNLAGTILVYATLTVPQAMLQESFLSFLGIGVKPPLPSWGRLAADGLVELNPYQSNWWLLVFPCAMLGGTLLALNFVGEGVREALDPKRRG